MHYVTRLALSIIILCAIAVFSTTIVRALFFQPDTEVPVPQSVDLTTNGDENERPTRIIIPRLQIDTRVQDVGITESGNMGVPNNFTDVGWYKYGALPGGAGSAVMAGHVDNGLGLSGVFKNLNTLEAGDEIIIEKTNGSRVSFSVTGKRNYPYEEIPTDIVFNPSGLPRLNLITCGGRWIQSAKTYDQRLVVFAKQRES
jgi:sortase A